MKEKTRLAIVVSHPIQHFVHFYRALAKREELRVKVFFCSRIGLEPYRDREMNTVIKWAGNLVDGYDHEFLPESRRIASTALTAVNNPSIGSALAAFRPDIVMLYGYAQLTQLRALAWCRLHGVPGLMTGGGNNVTQRSRFYAVLRSAVLRPLLSHVAGFLTVGDQNEAMLQALGVPRRRMFRTPFTIDEETYAAFRRNRAQTRAELRAQLGIPAEAFVLMAVGKMYSSKRMGDLIKACIAAAPGLKCPVHLIFCGDGSEREALQELARRREVPATFAGFVNVDRLPAFYCASDALVHPSARDNHPLVCSEAACIGLPLILSDQVGAIGTTDIAREGENASIYPCGDITALAEVITNLVNDQEKCWRMGDASLRIFEECNLVASVEGMMRAIRACAEPRNALPAA
jgi:glycosyltransferase involved in cell wall biosynthesis